MGTRTYMKAARVRVVDTGNLDRVQNDTSSTDVHKTCRCVARDRARQLFTPVSMGHQLSQRMQPCSQLQILRGPETYRQSGCAQKAHQ